MTFREFQKSWWSWLLFAAIVVVIGFVRGWDRFSIALLAVLGVTGVLRQLLGTFRTITIKRIANHLYKMPASKRGQELDKIAPEYRTEVQKELDNLSR